MQMRVAILTVVHSLIWGSQKHLMSLQPRGLLGILSLGVHRIVTVTERQQNALTINMHIGQSAAERPTHDCLS